MGEQERENTQDTFIWYLGNSTMIFPIDYSYREFAQETGRDYRTIKKYLEEDERLNGALNKLYSEKTETKHVPIPLEAGEFLLCYFELIQSKEFPKDFHKEKSKITEEQKEKFLHDLCRKLCQYFSSSKPSGAEDPQRIFYKHKLLPLFV